MRESLLLQTYNSYTRIIRIMRFHLKHQFIHKNLFSIVYSLKGIILQNQDSVKLNFRYKSLSYPPSPTSAVGDFLFFLNFFHFLVRKLPKNLLINKNNCPAHDTKPSKSPFTILSKRKVKNYDKKTELKTTQT